MSQRQEGMIKHNPELNQKKKSVRVTIYTDHNRIEADAYGFPSMRLTDLLNNSDNFIPLTDVVIYSLNNEEVTRIPFVSINKAAINMALEDE